MSDPGFWDTLELRVRRDGGYELLSSFGYHSNVAGRAFIVPAGFITDLASIPRVFRWLFTGHGKSREPSVIHDFLYRQRHPRKQADKVFREALGVAGMSLMARQAMYLAVRSGGWVYYMKQRGKAPHR